MFISQAYANVNSVSGELMSFVPLLVIFGLFFFLIIRPQMKQAKAHRTLITNLQVGDEVVITSGILGRITQITDQFIRLELSENTVILVQKNAVQSLLPKNTLKHLSRT